MLFLAFGCNLQERLHSHHHRNPKNWLLPPGHHRTTAIQRIGVVSLALASNPVPLQFATIIILLEYDADATTVLKIPETGKVIVTLLVPTLPSYPPWLLPSRKEIYPLPTGKTSYVLCAKGVNICRNDFNISTVCCA